MHPLHRYTYTYTLIHPHTHTLIYTPSYTHPHVYTQVPRPDGQPDFLGLRVLDEPALDSSDPAMLRMQLKTASKVCVCKCVCV